MRFAAVENVLGVVATCAAEGVGQSALLRTYHVRNRPLQEPTTSGTDDDMTESAVAYPTRPSNGTFWAAGALGILATAVAAILPILVGVWQKRAGLQVDQAGFVAATELFAQVAGTGVYLWALRKWTLRRIAIVGLCVMVVGNIATAVSADFASLMSAR